MNCVATVFATMLVGALLISPTCAQTDSGAAPAKKTAPKASKAAAAQEDAVKSAPAPKGGDTLVVVARISEIAGTFASNDLYNYVYVMKYRVLSVVNGSYKGQDILIGQYNPLIPRNRIKDAMKKCVSGNVEKFEVGAKQKLVLVAPIENVWKDAVDDEYPDSDLEKYFALKTDVAQ
jgi:hypothetical protein